MSEFVCETWAQFIQAMNSDGIGNIIIIQNPDLWNQITKADFSELNKVES